jgi:hypothetical protein
MLEIGLTALAIAAAFHLGFMYGRGQGVFEIAAYLAHLTAHLPTDHHQALRKAINDVARCHRP